MELRQLEYVVALAEELHFGRAAARLHVVQSALSQQVKRLERELGVTLFDRTTHYVRTTHAGDAFVTEARRVLSAADRARSAARLDVADELRVGVGETTIDTMPSIVHEIQRRFPNLVIHEVDGGLSVQQRAFAAGELDLALTQCQDVSLLGPGLSSEVIRVQPMGAYLASHAPAAELETLRLEDLEGQAFLFAPARLSPEFNNFQLDLLEGAGVEPRRYAGSTGSLAGALQVVSRGAAVLLGPEVSDLPPSVCWRPIQPDVPFASRLLRRTDDDSPLLEAARRIAHEVAASRGWSTASGDHSS